MGCHIQRRVGTTQGNEYVPFIAAALRGIPQRRYSTTGNQSLLPCKLDGLGIEVKVYGITPFDKLYESSCLHSSWKEISDYYCSEPEKKGQQSDLTKEERSSSLTTDDDQKMRSAPESFFTGNFAYEKYFVSLYKLPSSDIIAFRNRGMVRNG